MIKIREITLLAKNLSALEDAGISFDQALAALAKRDEKFSFGKILKNISGRVQEGHAISAAFSAEKTSWPPVFLETIQRGEASGQFGPFLQNLSEQLESQYRLEAFFKRILAYHVLLFLIGLGVFLILNYVLIPSWQTLFFDMGGALPLPTRFAFELSQYIRLLFPYAVLILSLLFLIPFLLAKKTGEPMITYLPLYGLVARRLELSAWLSTVSVFLTTASPLDLALQKATDSSSSPWLRRKMQPVIQGVREGKNLSEVLQPIRVFGHLLMDMVSFGEKQGSLPRVCEEAAKMLRNETKTLLAFYAGVIIEPMFTLTLGLYCGFLVLSVYLPIFTLTTSIQ